MVRPTSGKRILEEFKDSFSPEFYEIKDAAEEQVSAKHELEEKIKALREEYKRSERANTLRNAVDRYNEKRTGIIASTLEELNARYCATCKELKPAHEVALYYVETRIVITELDCRRNTFSRASVAKEMSLACTGCVNEFSYTETSDKYGELYCKYFEAKIDADNHISILKDGEWARISSHDVNTQEYEKYEEFYLPPKKAEDMGIPPEMKIETLRGGAELGVYLDHSSYRTVYDAPCLVKVPNIR